MEHFRSVYGGPLVMARRDDRIALSGVTGGSSIRCRMRSGLGHPVQFRGVCCADGVISGGRPVLGTWSRRWRGGHSPPRRNDSVNPGRCEGWSPVGSTLFSRGCDPHSAAGARRELGRYRLSKPASGAARGGERAIQGVVGGLNGRATWPMTSPRQTPSGSRAIWIRVDRGAISARIGAYSRSPLSAVNSAAVLR